jgi:hypothetical protein
LVTAAVGSILGLGATSGTTSATARVGTAAVGVGIVAASFGSGWGDVSLAIALGTRCPARGIAALGVVARVVAAGVSSSAATEAFWAVS